MKKPKIDTMKDVLPLMVKGMSDQEIADLLGFKGKDGARRHIKKILVYYGADNRTEATYHAFMRGDMPVKTEDEKENT